MPQTVEFPAPVDGCDDFEALFEDLPCAVLVLQQELHVVDFNRSAFKLMSQGADEVVSILLGDAIGCVHATEPPGGCGTTPSCKRCVLRNSAEETFRTGERVCAVAPMTLLRDGRPTSVSFLVGTGRVNGDTLVAATLQDLSQVRGAAHCPAEN